MEDPPLQFHNIGINVLPLGASFTQTVTANTFKFTLAVNYNQKNTSHSTFRIADFKKSKRAAVE